MAQYTSTTFGNIKGRHGTAVSSVRNGKVILRVYTSPSNPNSPKQVAQRTKFGFVISSLSPLRNIFNIGYGSKEGYNQALSVAMRKAVLGDYPDYSIDYSNVLVSSGSLPQATVATMAAQAGRNANITWDTTTWTNGSAKDLVHIVFFNPATRMVYFAEGKAERNIGELTIQLPAPWIGANIHAWFFISSPDYQLSSVSQYLGTIVPA